MTLESFVILYVSDQSVSRTFYSEVFEIEPTLDVPGMTEFQLTPTFRLGLMPSEGIVKLLEHRIPHPNQAEGIPRCELYLFTLEPEKLLKRMEEFGGRIISHLQKRDWGDEVGYGLDPDGHVLAFAKIPSETK